MTAPFSALDLDHYEQDVVADGLCVLAEESDDDLELVRFLSDVAVVVCPERVVIDAGCDGCDRVLAVEVFGAAGFGWSTAVDGNGDPDVSICPLCIAEAHEELPPEPTFEELLAGSIENEWEIFG